MSFPFIGANRTPASTPAINDIANTFIVVMSYNFIATYTLANCTEMIALTGLLIFISAMILTKFTPALMIIIVTPL